MNSHTVGDAGPDAVSDCVASKVAKDPAHSPDIYVSGAIERDVAADSEMS